MSEDHFILQAERLHCIWKGEYSILPLKMGMTWKICQFYF